MGNPLSVRLREIFQNKNEESWWQRVKENGRAFFAVRGAKVCAVGGAGAFDLLEAGPVPGRRQKQAASLLLHSLAIGILFSLGGLVKMPPQERRLLGPESFLAPPLESLLFGET